MARRTKITVWERLTPRKKADGGKEWVWRHNHVEYGWDAGDRPKPKSVLQRNSWRDAR